MPEFVDATVTQIDERLRELEGEINRLEAVRAILTNGSQPRQERARTRAGGSERSASRGRRGGRGRASTRAARGGTTASVLSVLAAGDALTATEVAAKAGLARPTVSTTLSKLARAGRVEKAERGYRLASATAS